MGKVKTDSQGRIYISKELREKYGEDFRLVEFKDEVRLIPISEDPVKDLRERTSKIRESDKTVEDLKKESRNHLTDEAGQ